MAADTRERMIATTARLLQHRGYYGTPLSAILDASAAPRGSLYFHFPDGKDELVIEATRRSAAIGTAALRAALEAAPDPATAVRRFFESTAAIMRESDFTYGCPVAPVILDASGGLEELARLCRETFEQWTGMLREAFAAAGIPVARAQTLALLVETSLEGLLLFSRAWRDVAPILEIGIEFETMIGAAIRDAKAASPKRPRRRGT